MSTYTAINSSPFTCTVEGCDRVIFCRYPLSPDCANTKEGTGNGDADKEEDKPVPLEDISVTPEDKPTTPEDVPESCEDKPTTPIKGPRRRF